MSTRKYAGVNENSIASGSLVRMPVSR